MEGLLSGSLKNMVTTCIDVSMNSPEKHVYVIYCSWEPQPPSVLREIMGVWGLGTSPLHLSMLQVLPAPGLEDAGKQQDVEQPNLRLLSSSRVCEQQVKHPSRLIVAVRFADHFN